MEDSRGRKRRGMALAVANAMEWVGDGVGQLTMRLDVSGWAGGRESPDLGEGAPILTFLGWGGGGGGYWLGSEGPGS